MVTHAYRDELLIAMSILSIVVNSTSPLFPAAKPNLDPAGQEGDAVVLTGESALQVEEWPLGPALEAVVVGLRPLRYPQLSQVL